MTARGPVALALIAGLALIAAPKAFAACGEVVTVAAHAGTTMRYGFAPAETAPKAALVLLAGGGGHIDLDAEGCPKLLRGNSLIRMARMFRGMGFATALVDAPSDHFGEDGLAGFRSAPAHAEDLGKVIAGVRARTRLPVWLVGTSRGTISAVNAASRLKGDAAPDGVVLTSALMYGNQGNKYWVRDSVFDFDLKTVTLPLLLVGHEEDGCFRSPPGQMPRLFDRLGSTRKQMVRMTGGPGSRAGSGPEACAGRSPHGFIKQERELAEGMARFIAGGRF